MFWDTWFGTPKEKRTQLFFRDDGKATFRKLEVEEASLVEKNPAGEIIKGWKHFYKLQFPFKGYGNIGADKVTLSFDRHYVLDPFDLLNKDERPPQDGKLDNAYISQIASGRCYKIESQKKGTSVVDKMTLFLGSGIILEIIIIAFLKLRA